jgi:methionyl-tRNA synthetase
MYQYKIREAQQEMMSIARIGNKYLAEKEPWKLIKTHPDGVKNILFVALKITEQLALTARLFLPQTAQKLISLLNLDAREWGSHETSIIPGNQIGAPFILFEKITDEWIEIEKSKLIPMEEKVTYAAVKPNVSFEEFQKMDFRLGKVTAAKKMEKANKLLVLTVDTGIDERTIVSGIAAHYTPEEILGKTVVVLMNLPPREIRGVVSEGMLLMAENHTGSLSAITDDLDFGAGPTIS